MSTSLTQIVGALFVILSALTWFALFKHAKTWAKTYDREWSAAPVWILMPLGCGLPLAMGVLLLFADVLGVSAR